PDKMLLLGVALVVVGTAFAVAMIQAGVAVVPAIGYVGVVAGVILIGNAVRERRTADLGDDPDRIDRRAVLALVLAVLVPPLGIVLGASLPSRGRAADLGAVAMLLGAVFSVLIAVALVLSARNS
ncbi:MAG: hypothetical protein JWN87_1978, partial [Frankiales bacterium]|nr:hypothetical protein [Frankiales bacterium]